MQAQLELDLDPPDLAVVETGFYHHPPQRPGFPYLTLNWRTGEHRMRQMPLPVSRIEWGLRQIFTRQSWQSEHWFISQNEFNRPDRQKVHLWSLGGCWVDIDLKSQVHDPKTQDRWRSAALFHCQSLGIPEPTLVIWSGHGLHVKWAFDGPLPAAALPRWNAVQRHLHDKMQSVGLPSDPQAIDASRILRIAGTFNNSVQVQVLHVGSAHDFDFFCEHVLPYSREDVRRFREDDKARHEATEARRQAWEQAGKTWAQWDANRAAAASFLRRATSFSPQEYAAREAAETLHHDRLQALRSIARSRGGIQPGQRNEWCWIVANSAAWGLGDPRNLYPEVVTLMREIAPSYTTAEARSSASSIYSRLKEGKDKLYKLKASTIIERLQITDDEARRHGLFDAGRQGHGTKNPGVMGLEKIHGLPFDQYVREVRRRFALGGQYSAGVRDEQGLTEARRRAAEASARSKVQSSEDKRSSARLMRAQGLSLRAIASELGVHHDTVREWCK